MNMWSSETPTCSVKTGAYGLENVVSLIVGHTATERLEIVVLLLVVLIASVIVDPLMIRLPNLDK